MKNGRYEKSEGARALGKRFSIFQEILKYLPVAVFIILYITAKERTKNIHRDIKDVEQQKQLMCLELERLTAEYDKMNTYVEIKDFAQKELGMSPTEHSSLCFSVYDNSDIFSEKQTVSMPKLFETNIKLALLEMKTDQP